MKEELFLYDGKGVIQLKGGPSETFLYIKKKPRIACFLAILNTVWRYHMGREIDENLIMENYQYENLVSSGEVNLNDKLSDQFIHIVQLLTNGNYELSLCEFPWSLDVVSAMAKAVENAYYDAYGGMAEIIATQTYLDQNVVDDYKDKIKNGQRPIVILLKNKDSWVIFIIDGHHKLQAYKELKINPKALIISKLDNNEIGQDKAIETMKELGMNNAAWIEIYKKEKETRAQERRFYNDGAKGLEFYFK